MIRGIHTYTVGKNKGKLRIWLENLSLTDANFVPGTPVSLIYENGITITQVSEEEAVQHVSGRKKNGREIPILDITRSVETIFSYKEKIRVEVSEGVIRITKVRSFAIIEEVAPANISLEKFKIIATPSGAGFACKAFTSTGLYQLAGACDMDSIALESLRYNDPDTILYHANMYDLHQDDLPDGDNTVFIYTPDCTSYSMLGRHDYVCSHSAPMNHHALRLISSKLFPVILLENVVEFGKTIWYQHFKRIMDALGYNVAEKVLNAWDFGTIASRPRFIVVCTLKPYRFEFPIPKLSPVHRDKVKKFVRDVENRKWMSISETKTLRFFFERHQAEQKARGNGFAINKNCIVGLDSKKMSLIPASYHKIQPIGPFLQHPNDPDKLSLFEPGELLKIQGFPEYEFPEWLSNTQRYKLIGQAVCGRMFRALAVSIATTMMEMKLGVAKHFQHVKQFIEIHEEIELVDTQGQLSFAF